VTVPEEIVLAVRAELGMLGRAELSDWVDRRLLASDANDALLALATPGDLAPEDVAGHLHALAGLRDDARVPRMQVVVVDDLFTSGALALDPAIAYLCVRVAPQLESVLRATCGGLDDMLFMAREGTWHTEAEVVSELHALADACRASLA
jgi:hypothetical protein